MNNDPYRNAPLHHASIIVTTTNDCEGHTITEYLGIVRGLVVRSMSFGQGFVGSFRALGGGNIQEYVDVCEEARQDAFRQMMHQAQIAGAHAVIGMRYDATEFGPSATEVLAYGTAVKLRRSDA